MEKRRFSRIPCNRVAELTVDGTVYPFARVENLSVGGCSLRTNLEFKPGAACRFWLPLELTTSELGVEVHGEIVRCDGEAVCIQFTKITPENLFHLHNLIRFNAPDPDRIEDEIAEHRGLV